MKTKKILSGIIVSMLAMLAANVVSAAEETKSVAVNAGIAYEKLNLKGKITSADIKNGTLKRDDFKKGAVTSKIIKDGTIQSKDIREGEIEADNLSDNSVTSEKIKDGTIVGADFADDSITSVKIADGNVTTNDLANDAVTTGKILDGTVATADVANNAINSAKILDGTIVAGDIADGAVTSAKILDGTIAGGDLASNIAIVTTGLSSLNGGIAVDGNFTVDGTTGDVVTAGDLAVNGDNITSDGTLDVNGTTGMSLNTTAGNVVIDAVVGGAGSVAPAVDSQDDLGTDATRWSTIYADTLNYSAAITDDNSADTTVAFGDDNALDTVTITANTSISDAEWGISNTGGARFSDLQMDSAFGPEIYSTGTQTLDINSGSDLNIGAEGISGNINLDAGNAINITAASTNIIGSVLLQGGTLTVANIETYGPLADADLIINAKGTGDIILGDTNSDVFIEDTLVSNNGITVLDGNVSIGGSGILDMTGGDIIGVGIIGSSADDISINSNDWDISASGVVSGLTGITSTGTVDISGGNTVIASGTSTPGVCSVGQMFVDTDTAPYLFVCTATDTWTGVN